MKRKRPYARKRFGQHFLSNPHVLDKIIGSIAVEANDHILEVGPGRGDLTHRLLKLGVPVTGIEIDRDLLNDLKQKFGDQDHFTLVEGDILKFDWDQLVQPDGRRRGCLG